mgnify:CR=1 FL=1
MSSGEVNYGEVTYTEKKITQLGYDNSSTKMVHINSVVIALAGHGKTRGTIAITRIPVCTNQSVCAIVPNKTLLSEYLFHFLKSQYLELRDISAWDGTRGGLNLKMIKAYKVPIPTCRDAAWNYPNSGWFQGVYCGSYSRKCCEKETVWVVFWFLIILFRSLLFLLCAILVMDFMGYRSIRTMMSITSSTETIFQTERLYSMRKQK